MKKDRFGQAMNILTFPTIIILALIMLIPVYIMFKVSVSAPQDVLTAHPPYLIRHFTWSHWVDVFQSGNLWGPFLKSFIVATSTTVVAIIVASPAAYVISRMPSSLKYIIVLGLLFTRMFPDIGIALAVSVNFVRWNLLDTDLGLILAHLIPNLPFVAWILVGTFDTVPKDLEESAQIDGTTRLGALRKVIFPVAAPGIAVGAMFVWLNSWNEFTYALYLSLTNKTLPLQTFYYLQRGDWFVSAAYSTILTIPVIIITFLLQRYLKSGYLSGAVKG